MSPELFLKHAYADDDGIFHLENGLFETTGNEVGPCFVKNQHGEHSINYDTFKYIKGNLLNHFKYSKVSWL